MTSEFFHWYTQEDSIALTPDSFEKGIFNIGGNFHGPVAFGPGAHASVVTSGDLYTSDDLCGGKTYKVGRGVVGKNCTYVEGGDTFDVKGIAKAAKKAAKAAKKAEKMRLNAYVPVPTPVHTINLSTEAVNGKYQKASEDGQVWQATLVLNKYLCEWWGVTDPVTGKFPYEKLEIHPGNSGSLGGLTFKH